MDSEFPDFLNTSEKQITKAKQLALQHLGFEPIAAQHVALQGMFSKTVRVSFRNGGDGIIQFRIEPLDTEPFTRARNVLGEFIPLIEAIDDIELTSAGIWPFYMNCIPGKPWANYEHQWSDAQRINASISLGQVLGGCCLEGSSAQVVDNVIIPSLQKIRAIERDDVKPFFPLIERLIKEAPRLKKLPLFVGHYDLNEMNILADDCGRVTGIVDWELSPAPQPFGIGLYGIHFLAGGINNKIFSERPIYEKMERGFWNALVDAVPEPMREVILSNPEAVQTSVLVGIILRVIAIEGDQVMIGDILLRALPYLMRYQIPAIRGSRAAYAIV
jgi:hypothetical protein